MKIFIVTFLNDLASVNERDYLISNFNESSFLFDNNLVYILKKEIISKNEIYLLTTNNESIFYDNLDESIISQLNLTPDLIIFATKHQSKAGINSLSCHGIGNWGIAEYGGKDLCVCKVPANLLALCLNKLNDLNLKYSLGYDVILECTHHGPFLKTPCIFIEIGSCIESWNNQIAGQIISETLISVLPSFNLSNSDFVSAIGIGGLHHCPEFNKKVLSNLCVIGHICPKYALDKLNYDLLKNAIECTIPFPEIILLDWKGIGIYKENISKLCDLASKEFNLKIIKTNNFY